MFCVNSNKYNILYYLLAFRLALYYSPFARGSCASRPTMPRTQGKSGMKTSYLKGSLLIPPLRLRVSAVKNPCFLQSIFNSRKFVKFASKKIRVHPCPPAPTLCVSGSVAKILPLRVFVPLWLIRFPRPCQVNTPL